MIHKFARLFIGVALAVMLASAAFSQTASAMASKYKSMMSSFTSRSIVNTAACYSEDFFNGGYDFEDVCASMGVVFGAKSYKVKLSSFSTTYTEVALPYGYLEGTMRVREYSGSTLISDGYYSISMYFVSQGGKWYFYGDQQDVALRQNATAKDSWKEAFGLKMP